MALFVSLASVVFIGFTFSVIVILDRIENTLDKALRLFERMEKK